MVSSLDGIIAKHDNSVSWFTTTDFFEQGVELTKEEEEIFLKSINCYVMGANTYLHALELSKNYGWPYGDVPTIVLSHRKLPIEKSNVEIYSGDLHALVNEKLKSKYKNVWIVGGAIVAKEFIRLKLVHEIRLSVLPIILGEGKMFLNELDIEQSLHLKNVTAYKNGMVELWYEVKG